MKISVLINSRNRADSLKKCLKSIFAQNYPDFEVLILDDASDNPEEYSQLSKIFNTGNLFIHRLENPIGVSAGRNFLMKQAKGEIFFVIDDDAILIDKNAFFRITEIFKKRKKVGIIAFRIETFDSCNRKRKKYNVPFSIVTLKIKPKIIEKSQNVAYFLGGGHAIRREVIEECGGYAEKLYFGEEELDLSYRVISKGWEIWYESNVIVHHFPQPSSLKRKEENYDEEFFHHVKNRIYIAWRYLNFKYLIVYICIWLLRFLLQAANSKRKLKALIKGIREGITWIKEVEREPLSVKAIKYIKKYNGRLWY